jgi:hypothetical protein
MIGGIVGYTIGIGCLIGAYIGSKL